MVYTYRHKLGTLATIYRYIDGGGGEAAVEIYAYRHEPGPLATIHQYIDGGEGEGAARPPAIARTHSEKAKVLAA